MQTTNYNHISIFLKWELNLQLPVQSVPITTKVVSSNAFHGEVYSIQHYVIKCVNDLRQVVFSRFSLQNWAPRYNWNIVESGRSCICVSEIPLCASVYLISWLDLGSVLTVW